MRPLADDVQKLPRGIERFAYPRTRAGLALRGAADKLLTSGLLRPLRRKLITVAETDQQLPALTEAATSS